MLYPRRDNDTVQSDDLDYITAHDLWSKFNLKSACFYMLLSDMNNFIVGTPRSLNRSHVPTLETVLIFSETLPRPILNWPIFQGKGEHKGVKSAVNVSIYRDLGGQQEWQRNAKKERKIILKAMRLWPAKIINEAEAC